MRSTRALYIREVNDRIHAVHPWRQNAIRSLGQGEIVVIHGFRDYGGSSHDILQLDAKFFFFFSQMFVDCWGKRLQRRREGEIFGVPNSAGGVALHGERGPAGGTWR